MEFRIGQGYDVHALKCGLPMWLGGMCIPDAPAGFVAHSDGDVALHALCDALLGALALGDIGKHFPDTSDKWKGADSKELLAAVMEMVTLRGWAVVNTDITIALQAPKIGKYTEEMRGIIAGILGITAERVSIKATTTEKLGFTGRSEGCQVWAVVLLSKD
ncbi:MAG: 2-C-methyl-D-erythritol 2,4-cyclodiphosphate synthase [Bacteroidales bacterium]|nr:2-C-methyl-D-erythritol 2,4-cyclodiphosphate synthase [Bacteroidales bacterium]